MTARQYEKEGRLSRFSLDRRISVLVLFLTMLVATISAQQLLPGDDDVVVREWSFDEDAEGWAPLNNLADFTIAEGVLRTQATGDDAALGITSAGVDCSNVSRWGCERATPAPRGDSCADGWVSG